MPFTWNCFPQRGHLAKAEIVTAMMRTNTQPKKTGREPSKDRVICWVVHMVGR